MNKILSILIFCLTFGMADKPIDKIEIKKKLIHTLKDVKEYKSKKNKQIKKLHSELNKLHRELAKLKTKLVITDKKLNQIQKKIKTKDIDFIVNTNSAMKIAMSEPPSFFFDEKKIDMETIEEKEPISSWVEVIVEDGIDIYQLALKYYGNREEYQYIYSANQNIIGNNLIIKDGMTLKIPIIENFEEQPVILNRN